MNYSSLINQSVENVYRAGIATKIMQHMDRIRNVSDCSQARRWIMELIQNSRDTAYEDTPVKIRVELYDHKLCFMHSGKPFRIKDILSIVNQVSGKTDDSNSVGQFGTGFMTTYLLSEKVTIKSFLRDTADVDGTKMELPYKPFEVTLDRTGHTSSEILEAINAATDDLMSADNNPEETNFDKTALNTTFCYALETKKSFDAAMNGIKDLEKNIVYIMLFSSGIDCIEISVQTSSIQYEYRYKRESTKMFTDKIGVLIINKFSNKMKRNATFITEDGITLATECQIESNVPSYVPLHKDTSRIFIDFPLIGTESFAFPMVINSRNFRPNEPRSNITLVDNVQSVDAACNKALLTRTLQLYQKMLEWSAKAGCGGMENIIAVPPFEHNREMSDEWVTDNLYNGLYRIVSAVPIIPMDTGNHEKYAISTETLYLADAKTDEEYHSLKQLISDLTMVNIPSDRTDWWAALKNYPLAKDKYINLSKLVSSASLYFKKEFHHNKSKMAQWLFQLYNAAMKNKELEIKIRSEKAAIFLSDAEDDLELKTASQLRNGRNIPDSLVDVCNILDNLDGVGRLNLPHTLLHKEMNRIDDVIPTYEITVINEYIIKRSDRNFKVRNFSYNPTSFNNIWYKAWFKLISCCPDNQIYSFFDRIKYKNLPAYSPITTAVNLTIFNYAIKYVLNDVAEKIKAQKCLSSLKNQYFSNEEMSAVYAWLQTFYTYVSKYSNSTQMGWLLPNQKGEFTHSAYNALSADKITYTELRDILCKFSNINSSFDVRNILVDKNIDTTKMNLPDYTDIQLISQLSPQIDKCVNNDLKKQPEAYQDACTMLLAWIVENPELAKEHFPAYCSEENHIKLQTPAVAVRNYTKSLQYDKLCELMGSDDVEAITELLKKGLREKTNNDDDRLYQLAAEMEVGFDFDEFQPDWTYDQKEDYIRQIGNTGEKYAYEKVTEHIRALGYEVQSSSQQVTIFVSGNKSIKVISGDHGNHHQAGWDHCIEICENGLLTDTHYIEVKTHTISSVLAGQLKLTFEQMSMAFRKKDHYHIASVMVTSGTLAFAKIDYYTDVLNLLGNGSLILRNSESILCALS